jgi:hypothetical protein
VTTVLAATAVPTRRGRGGQATVTGGEGDGAGGDGHGDGAGGDGDDEEAAVMTRRPR